MKAQRVMEESPQTLKAPGNDTREPGASHAIRKKEILNKTNIKNKKINVNKLRIDRCFREVWTRPVRALRSSHWVDAWTQAQPCVWVFHWVWTYCYGGQQMDREAVLFGKKTPSRIRFLVILELMYNGKRVIRIITMSIIITINMGSIFVSDYQSFLFLWWVKIGKK